MESQIFVFRFIQEKTFSCTTVMLKRRNAEERSNRMIFLSLQIW